MKNKEVYFEDLKGKVDNIFVLVNLASKRVRELVSGSPKLIQIECDDPMQIALEEIAQDKITVGKKKEEEKEASEEEQELSPKEEKKKTVPEEKEPSQKEKERKIKKKAKKKE